MDMSQILTSTSGIAKAPPADRVFSVRALWWLCHATMLGLEGGGNADGTVLAVLPTETIARSR